MHPRSDDSSIAEQGNRMAKLVACRAIARRELLLLAPRSTGADKHISGALVSVHTDVMPIGSNENGICTNRDRAAEEVLCMTIGSGQFRLLSPNGACANEDIG